MSHADLTRRILISCTLLAVAACAPEDPNLDQPGDPLTEDLPLGDLDEGDMKADGWGAATTCKEIPDLAPLADPAITISIDGLTLHLIDRAGDYDAVFPVGVGSINSTQGETTYNESRSMFPVLADDTSDFTIKTTDNYNFNPCRIWWTDPATGEEVPVFAGLPFLRWRGAYGIHGPITNYRAQNGGELKRGYVSHGCVRMEAADILELYARVRGVTKVPVHVQRAPERDDAGTRVDVADPWIGAECSADADCSFTGGFCKVNAYSARGFCTKQCTTYCPDREHHPESFCVADPDDADQGICTVKETGLNHECRPQDHFIAVEQSRLNQPWKTARVCMPGSRGWIGDHCFVDQDCQEGNRCAGATTEAPGICTQSCGGYCPDSPGAPATFCIDEPSLGGANCVRRCSPESNGSECPADSICTPRPRSTNSNVVSHICLPH